MIAARFLSTLCLALLSVAPGHAGGKLPETMAAPDPRPAETISDTASAVSREEAACRARLRALGAVFVAQEPIAAPEGCVVPFPLSVSQLPGGVTLQPPAVLGCAMAEATARFVRDHAAPLTQATLGSGLAAIDQASSYVCRPRNGTSRLSEHAFANALDWAALRLEDGTVIPIRAFRRSEPRRARLVSGLRQAACGPFRTVLGPGSDADHADHLHFDLAERRGNATFCQ